MEWKLRAASEADHDEILRLNEENVEVLSPMDRGRLEKLHEASELLLVAEAGEKIAGFLIALREGVDFYDSENYIWFSRTYEKFLYIDRIAIDEPYRSMGIGREMYRAVFDQAKRTGLSMVTAEIDTIPYNEPSLKFHKAMGFTEVGTQFIRNNTIRVSLQKADIS